MFGCRGHREIGYLMSKQAVSNVTYPVTPGTTVLLSIDCQFGFGAGSWEQVPHADTVVVGGLTTPICVQTTVDALSMTGFKVIVLADACASQAIGTLSAEQAHAAAIQRMAYLFAAVEDTEEFVGKVRARQPAAG
jgi:nicotinamidase-related amidase